jgi:hypothetical protein
MTQGVLPFKYEEEKKDFGITSFSGALVFLDLLWKMGFMEMVEENLQARREKQGWSDIYFLVCLILLNLCGGGCVDDVKVMEKDEGIGLIMKHLEKRKAFGRGVKKWKRQWRNGKRNALPSPSAIFRYLMLFHEEYQERIREEHKAYIPESNENLRGLSRINKEMLEFLQSNKRERIATIDMDATIAGSNKEEALYSYKGEKGYQPLNVWWWEQKYMLYSEFRDGNVPAGYEQKRVLKEALECLPEGVEKVYVRSDTAGYQHELLRYCEKGENERWGRIEFAISCDVVEEFKRAVNEVEEGEWRGITMEIGGRRIETGQEWAEVCYVPSQISHSKRGPEYRYIAIREILKQKELPGMEDFYQQSFPFPNMRINRKRYKIFGLVTNMKWEGEEIIHWSRKRCGYSEQAHSEMKEALCGGQFPSGKFGVNAAWWWIMVISLNVAEIMRSVVLGESFKKSRMKKLRLSIINIGGRVIKKGKELIVRISKGHPSFGILIEARRAIAGLRGCSLALGLPSG